MCCNGSFLYKLFHSKSNKNNKLHYIMVHVTIKLLKLNEWLDLLLVAQCSTLPWHWLNKVQWIWQWLFFVKQKHIRCIWQIAYPKLVSPKNSNGAHHQEVFSSPRPSPKTKSRKVFWLFCLLWFTMLYNNIVNSFNLTNFSCELFLLVCLLKRGNTSHQIKRSKPIGSERMQ